MMYCFLSKRMVANHMANALQQCISGALKIIDVECTAIVAWHPGGSSLKLFSSKTAPQRPN
eukprot:7929047-Pyramimonas_sp.AAC.1